MAGDLYSTLQREVRLGTHEFDWYHRGKEVALAVARGIHFLHTSGVTHRFAHTCDVHCSPKDVEGRRSRRAMGPLNRASGL